MMRELSLFSGAGGGLLATKHLLGWETVGYVEYNEYCQKVIAARIKDGLLDDAPIFGDIRAFIDQGFAASYTGMVDVVSGGFPCQPFSRAGLQLGANDPRNMWPATREVIRIIKPRYAYLENVPGLLGSGYFGTVIGDLAQLGMDVKWGVLSACAVGAPHTRERLWILSYNKNTDEPRGLLGKGGVRGSSLQPGRLHSNHGGATAWDWHMEPKPRMVRVANGMGPILDSRHRAIGNGQVPAVAATAWRILSGEL